MEVIHHLDTPPAYEPQFIIDMPALVQSPEGLPSIENLNAVQRKLLTIEEADLGISMVNDPKRFLAAHNERALNFQSEAGNLVRDTAPEFCEILGDHLTALSPETRNWHEIIQGRIGRIRNILVSDYLKTSNLGMFSLHSNNFAIGNAWSLIEPRGAKDELGRIVIPHELIHAASVIGISKNAIQNEFGSYNSGARTGLQLTVLPTEKPVSHPGELVDHARLLSESVVENTRARLFPSAEHRNGYVAGVAVLRSLVDMTPEVVSQLELGIFAPTNPSVVFGQIESSIGPTGIETLEKIVEESFAFQTSAEQLSYTLQRVQDSQELREKTKSDFALRLGKHVENARPIRFEEYLEQAVAKAA